MKFNFRSSQILQQMWFMPAVFSFVVLATVAAADRVAKVVAS